MKYKKEHIEFRKYLMAFVIVLLTFIVLVPASGALADEDAELWQSIREDLYDNRAISEEDGNVTLEAPNRAQDAAVVPLKIKIPASVAGSVKALTLVIDKNPAPIAAKFTFGEAAGIGEREISTRVRVNMYSNVRAIIETKDGKLHMATKYVKAAGGCSAPALKDQDQAMANLGKMKLRWVSGAQAAAKKSNDNSSASQSPIMAQARVMIRHPNYSGMQMNQLTGLYIPAKFVDNLSVFKGDKMVFAMEGGISISENPNLLFTYEAGGNAPLRAVATDTDGNKFKMQAVPKAS